MHDMDLTVSLISLLLVAGAGRSSHANVAVAFAMTPSRTPIKHWQAVLPDMPMPAAIRDLVTQPTGDMHYHLHNHGDRNRRLADVFFFHDVLRPGSVITPIIPLTTFLPSLLPRRVADSIPFSTERFIDILEMFGPMSAAMAGDVKWTLDTCELPGDKAGCATSLESLAEIPVALLGTRDVRAFSPDMAVDLEGTPARRGRYNVTAVRKLSDSPEIVTCRDLTYPYAVFYCHTANSTAAYAVMLAGMDAPPMEELAVCHLNTSRWNPKNPFFELHGLKPGEVAVCHFLSKLSLIWVPADKPGGRT